MFERIRARLLRWMRVPHDPDPPAGAPGSIRVFRAGQNLYKLRLVRWGIGQIGALAGIIFSLAFLAQLERGVEQVRREALEAQKAKAAAPAVLGASSGGTSAPPESALGTTRSTSETTSAAPAEPTTKTKVKAKTSTRQRNRSGVQRLAERTPTWLFPFLSFLEWAGVVIYVLQIPLTFAMVRLDFELRWYIVTDRSLRIRSGLTSVQESTMSFANIQQVVVTQGPLQRLLGLADVRVQSAGGGGGEGHPATAGESLHAVMFQGVDNALEIRDLIAERLRQFRATGLGDPDERAMAHPHPLETAPVSAALGAAHELLRETQALRQALG